MNDRKEPTMTATINEDQKEIVGQLVGKARYWLLQQMPPGCEHMDPLPERLDGFVFSLFVEFEGAGDGEAVVLHDEMHRRVDMLYPHSVGDRSWSEDGVRNAIAKLADKGYPPEQFYRPLREHLERAPHTVAFDDLRLHLLDRHCLINAATLADHAVIDAHEHEHDGPGTIRNHPRDDHSWTVEKVGEVLADVDGEPDELEREYIEAAHRAMARLKERASDG